MIAKLTCMRSCFFIL